MPSHGSDARTVHRQEGLRLVAWQSALLCHWTTPTTPPLLAQVTHDALALAAGHPHGIAVVYHMDHDVLVSPDEPTRREYLRQIQALKGVVRCGAVLRQHDGLAASITRSVLTGVLLLAQPPMPIRFFNRPPELCSWVVGELTRGGAAPISAAALLSALTSPQA